MSHETRIGTTPSTVMREAADRRHNPIEPCDYDLIELEVVALSGAALLPADFRLEILTRYAAKHGCDAVVNMLVQFIGLANSVVANNREMIELAGIISGELHPYNAEQINLPTIFGALGGVTLAASADQNKVCHGCAFRLGAVANQCPPTVIDAQWCQNDSGQDFMCHEDLDEGGNPRKLCRGYAQARRASRSTGIGEG